MKWNLELSQQNEKRSRADKTANVGYTENCNESEPEAICGTSIGSSENAANEVSEGTKLSSAAAKNLRAKFFVISIDTDNVKYATCKIDKCTKVIKMSNGNTTGLKRHLERDHPKSYIELYGGTIDAKKVYSLNTKEKWKIRSEAVRRSAIGDLIRHKNCHNFSNFRNFCKNFVAN